MPYHGWLIPIVVGAAFIVLGLGAIIWGNREEKSYYDSLSSRTDLREFFSHWPKRPEPGALKIGGWIAIAVGLLMAAMGGAFLLWS